MAGHKYLGLIMDEHLSFNILLSSTNRAVESICKIVRNLKDLGCLTFTQMYHSGVTVILEYASGIWRYIKYENIGIVQNRAIHLYLGVHANIIDMRWLDL